MAGSVIEPERGEDDADVADDVVLARHDAAELGIGRRAEHAGEHQHGHRREADQADEHAGLATQQPQLACG